MSRAPVGVYLFAACSAILGLSMATEGLHLHLFHSYLRFFFDRPMPWFLIPQAFNLSAYLFAWPLTAVGTSWLGVMMGVIMGLRWARRAAWFYAVLSLAYLGIGTVLSVLLILGLRAPATQAWLELRSRHADERG